MEKQPQRQRIVIGINSLTESQYPAYTNHIQFMYRLGRSYPHIDFILHNPARMSIDRMRNYTAKIAVESEASHILFLDDDVITNPNYGLQMLLDCNADCAAAKVVIRGYPFDYMTFKRNKDGGLKADSKLPNKGMVKRDAVGFSFALLKTDIFKKMPGPWFITGINNTEDIYFCIKAKSIDPNYTIKVNCELTCGHILWPEIMDSNNRDAYIKYYKEINPSLTKRQPRQSGKDRGADYLRMIKAITKQEVA